MTGDQTLAYEQRAAEENGFDVRRGDDLMLAEGAEFDSQLVRQIVIEKNLHGTCWMRCESANAMRR